MQEFIAHYFSASQDSMTNYRWNAGREEGLVGHYSSLLGGGRGGGGGELEIVCIVSVAKNKYTP